MSGLTPKGPRDQVIPEDLYLSQRARRRAMTLLQEARWDEAGALFESEADGAPLEVAAPIWLSAISAYRRADRPAAALRCLVRLQEVTPLDAPHASTAAIERAGVVLDLGELGQAIELALHAVETAPSAEMEAVALDLQAGAMMLSGNLAEAEEAIRHMTGPLGSVAARFRTGQLLRLRGDLPGARKTLLAASEALPVVPETAGAHGQIELDLAELAFVQDDLEEAELRLEEASAAFQVARRRPGLFRTEALRLEVALQRGVSVVARSLDTAIAYARDRQLALLEAELLTTRGKARTKGQPDFDRAVELAEAAGAVLLEGRARYARRRWGQDPGDSERAKWCLESDRVLLARW
jgi:tetratricopeptide (TPR) repeat protein